MQTLSPSIINGCSEIIENKISINLDGNEKNIYKNSFVTHDDCVRFLKYLNISSHDELIEECYSLDVNIAQNLIIKYISKNTLSEWGRFFSLGIDSYRLQKEENPLLNKPEINWIDQLINQYILDGLDECKKSRNALNLIKEKILSENNTSDLIKTGNIGEELTLKYESNNKKVISGKIVSHYSDSKGYDVEVVYKDSLKKLIEVKTSKSRIATGAAHISFGQWKKAKEIEEIENRVFVFHFWSIEEKMLAEVSASDMIKKIDNLDGNASTKSHWEKFKVYFDGFSDLFFTPKDLF